MIERGRDEAVEAMVLRWMRRVAGAADTAPGARRKDEVFPGRLPDPGLPYYGATTGDQQGAAHIGTVHTGSATIPPSIPAAPSTGGDDAAIAAAAENTARANRVYEHDIDDLQPVLAFGAIGDFNAVRGTATISTGQAAAVAVAEGVAPNLAQLWSRSDRYTDVRVASRFNTGSVGLWIGASFAGAVISGYLGTFDAAILRNRIYRVDANALTLIANSPLVVGQTIVEFQRVGTTLRIAAGNRVMTAIDATYGAGYVGFGAENAAVADICDSFEVTRPTV